MDNTGTLLEMLTYRRPGRSKTEEEFIAKFLMPLGVKKDDYGNLILRIGTDPIMWSCHTDTVHRQEGRQVLQVSKGVVSVNQKRTDGLSNCLGADCTTGVWIMTEMIKAGIEGLYIFHRDEEVGGRGSNWIVDNTPDLVDGIQAAIAFDRYGTTSVITYQMSKCCSNDFADSLIEQMPGFKKDPGGVFTDTAFYTALIPECTNLSVGYMGHHSASETQDLKFAAHLLNLMKKLDTGKLRISRDVTEKTSYSWMELETSHPYGGVPDFDSWEDYLDSERPRHSPLDKEESFLNLVKNNPRAAASLLRLYGVSNQEFVDHVFASSSDYRKAI